MTKVLFKCRGNSPSIESLENSPSSTSVNQRLKPLVDRRGLNQTYNFNKFRSAFIGMQINDDIKAEAKKARDFQEKIALDI